jgi:predicted RNA methylase
MELTLEQPAPLAEAPRIRTAGAKAVVCSDLLHVILDNCTIYNADFRDVLPRLTCDAIITDPPYGVGVNYGEFVDTPENTIPLVLAMLETGMKMSKRIAMTPGIRLMWEYPKPTHTGSFYYPAGCGVNPWGFTCWQPIHYYGNDPYAGKGSRPDSRESVEAAEKNGHPCPKPIKQWTWLVNRASLEGETVCDPMMGSGTTAIACIRTKRNFIGIEKDKRHFEAACERIRREQCQGVML